MAFRHYLFNKFQALVPSLTTGQSWPTVIDSTGALLVNTEGRKLSYRGTAIGQTPVASLTGPFFSLTGSATRLVRITKVRFSASAATGAATQIELARYANIQTGGGTVASTITAASHDLLNIAATALCQVWSAPPFATAGQTRGFAAEQYVVVTNAVSVLPQIIEWKFADVPSQELTLRGTTDSIGLQIVTAGTTPLFSGFFEWTEEPY